jgi:hypothetical protein
MTQPTLGLLYAPGDAEFARRLRDALAERGYTAADGVQPGDETLALLVQTPAAFADSDVMSGVYAALDAQQHVIPVMRTNAPLPKLIAHLTPIDFSGAFAMDELTARIDYLLSPDGPAPLVLLTPSRRRRNRKAGWVFTVLALAIFAIGIYMVGVLGLRSPTEEYDAVETQRVDVRNTIIAPTLDAFLPRSSEDAANFQPTVDAMPTRLRPFLAATATALAGVEE